MGGTKGHMRGERTYGGKRHMGGGGLLHLLFFLITAKSS